MNQNQQLFINGQPVDFGTDAALPLILQVNNLGDLQSLQGNGSKALKLPLTQRNREIFGFPDSIPFNTGLVYKKLPAKYIVSGIEIVSNGFVEIQNVQNNGVDILLLFGNIDFLDRIGGQIFDMGDSTTFWSGFGANLVWNQYSMPFPNNPADIANCIFDVRHAALSQQKTSGWIFPIVNYGSIDTTPPFIGYINVRNQRPGFFLHTAIELLVQSTGYSIDQSQSCIYNDPTFADLYQKLIIQFDNGDFEHGADWQNTPDNLGATLSKGIDQVISRSRADLSFPWDQTNIYQNDNPFSNVISFNPTDHYTATTTVSFTATFQFNLYMRGKIGGSSSFFGLGGGNAATEVIVRFTLVDPGGAITDAGSQSFTMDNRATILAHNPEIAEQAFLNQKLSQDFQFVAGQQLYVRVHINNIGQTFQDAYVIVRNSATLSIITNEKIVLWGQPIQTERILPNVSQLSLLTDTLQRFGLILIADPNTQTIIFTSFKVIVSNIPIARDWSEKCLDMGDNISFTTGNYSQVNWLRYQQDDSIPINYMPKYFADDSISIADETLNPTQPVQDLFVSLFAPSINCPYIGGTIAQISDPTDTDDFSVGSQPRLLVDRKLKISQMAAGGQSISVTFADNFQGFEDPTQTVVINDIISVPYFYKPDGDYNLAWKDLPGNGINFTSRQRSVLQGLKSKYYKELENILTQSKKPTRYIYLKPSDILDFDFTIPVYIRQDSAYYYVSKIDSWIEGQPIKVDLIRL